MFDITLTQHDWSGYASLGTLSGRQWTKKREMFFYEPAFDPTHEEHIPADHFCFLLGGLSYQISIT